MHLSCCLGHKPTMFCSQPVICSRTSYARRRTSERAKYRGDLRITMSLNWKQEVTPENIHLVVWSMKVFIIALSSQARGFRSHGGSRSSWAAGGKVVDSWPLGPGVWPPSIMMGYDVTMAVISGSSAKNDALLMNVLIFFGIISFKMYGNFKEDAGICWNLWEI